MSYSERDGQVVLTMSRPDYELLLLWLGMATGGILKDGDNADGIIAFLNRLNEGNPNYTPYEVKA
jgi:hypothetical protein